MRTRSEPSTLRTPSAAGGEPFFATSLEHLLAELERIDLLIRFQVRQARRTQEADGEFQGLYIAEEEVDELLAAPAGLPRWAAERDGWPPEVQSGLARLAQRIQERRMASAGQGIGLRLEELARRFGLSRFEVDSLLIALAPEIDLRYERLFAYLQDDVTKKRPSVDLVLNLLCPDFARKLASRSRFTVRAPLVRHRLVELFEDPSRPHPPLLARYLRADERIVAYLFGGDELDARLSPHARLIEPAARLGELVLAAGVKDRLASLARAGPGHQRAIYLQGGYGVGRTAAAAALCREWRLKLLEVELEPLLADGSDFTLLVELAGREAALQGAAVCWRGFERLLADGQRAGRALFLERLAAEEGPSFLAGDKLWEPADALHGVDFLRYELPLPDHGERLQLWSRALDCNGAAAVESGELAALAVKFRLSGGQVRDASATAASLARRRAAAGGRMSLDDLYAACRLQSNRMLGELARKITPCYRWDDIVLPRDRMEQLREICNTMKHRARVYEDWGFGAKLSLGKGLNVLFSGPSGTGKTMAAEILAGELGLDLYKIDLSTVVSKYIGETEKNLARIFDEAETSNAILFFDEADALFGKRSEVRDSHDRYANLEISYLLQRMEEYEGVAILATNLRKNMDDAFVRRMHFSVDFPFPDPRSRRRIWAEIWPRQLPRSAQLDLDGVARRFEIAGGNIRNIAVSASFLAAEDGARVDTPHLLRATRREYQKMGKVMAVGELEGLGSKGLGGKG